MATKVAKLGSDAMGKALTGFHDWRRSLRSPIAALAEEGLSIRVIEIIGYLVLAGTALGMRLWDLGSRALHHDESLHAYFSWFFYSTGKFEHNPLMHGPFLFEATAGLFRILGGPSDYTSRVLAVIFGTVLVILPYFFRERLGRIGALLISVMLVFSPAMFYYSRFIRNDIIMAVWAFGLVICMWRYIDTGKNRFLYFAAGLLAFAFATKETSYIVLVTIGMYLSGSLFLAAWGRTRTQVSVEGLPPATAIGRFAAAMWPGWGRVLRFEGLSRQGIFLLLLVTLALPQFSASVSILEYLHLWPFPNLVLAAPEGVGPAIGVPVGGGIVIAFIVSIGLILVSAFLGFKWKWGVWWRCALVFYVIWGLLYSTFFTNWVGFGSGIWQGLGYWIIQQEVARGNQPWYYYFLITPLYEFLPLLLAFIGGVYYMRKNDRFGMFLVFWAVVTFIFYTIASEKMPWLLVNIALPVIVLGGRFLGGVLEHIPWRREKAAEYLLVLAGVPIALALLWRLAFFGVGDTQESFVILLLVTLVLAALIPLGFFIGNRLGGPTFASLALLPIVVILFALTVQAGFRVTYQNGDIPVEMLIYVQSTSDIPKLTAAIREEGRLEGTLGSTPVTIDTSSGFQWPWAWYLRDEGKTGYPSLASAPNEVPDSKVILVHHDNDSKIAPMLRENYLEGQRFRFRWWFPEETYRNLTPGKILTSFGDREAWRRAMDYLLYRKMSREPGSEDGVVYLAKDFRAGFQASLYPR